MNFIDRTAERVAFFVRQNNPNAGSETALKYSFSLIFNTFISICISLLICLFTGHESQAIICISAFLLLRYLSGGVHLSSSVACCFVSVLITIVPAHMAFPYEKYGLSLDVISIIILLFRAPNGIENISNINPKYYPILKLFCVALVFSNILYFRTPILASVFLIQALSVTQTAYKVVNSLERRLAR
jgi:accessory gene regulator B